MPVSKRWVLAPQGGIHGLPSEENFEIQEDHTPDLAPGEILVRALFFSVDPIIRLYMDYSMEEGDTIPGRQVARVVESRHKMFTKGKLVYGSMGWQTYCIVQPDETQEMCGKIIKLVDELPKQVDMSVNSTSLPKSACLGVLGIPGLSAYLSLVHLCKARAGETVVISSAAGQIGHLAGQIAKILGLNVIGYTGDGEKSSWIKTGLGFDWAFNYRTQDVQQTLKIAAPGGVDIFLDSVGGKMYNTVVTNHMKFGGRICIFGNLALYNNISNNNDKIDLVHPHDMIITLKSLSIYGFNVYHHFEHFESALDQLSNWCRQGKLTAYEHVVEGFENLPKTFIEQLQGKSQGKVIVRTG